MDEMTTRSWIFIIFVSLLMTQLGVFLFSQHRPTVLVRHTAAEVKYTPEVDGMIGFVATKSAVNGDNPLKTVKSKGVKGKQSSNRSLSERPVVSQSLSSKGNISSAINKNSWKRGTFCHNFFENTFQMPTPVCVDSLPPCSVECFGNPYSRSMATCTLRNIAVMPHLLLEAMSDPDRPKFVSNKQPIALLKGEDSNCVKMTLDNIRMRVEGGDYVLKVVEQMKRKQLNTSVCDVWVNDTAFFFTAHRFHIYFRFLDYYNVHKLLGDMKHDLTNGSRLVRISGSGNYMFPEFEQTLFPEVKTQTLEDLQNVNTCFKKVVLVPKSYASPIFQCKNRVSLRGQCMDCDGSGLNGSSFNLFSNRVVKACSEKGKIPPKNSSLIILISRTPYLRSSKDNLNKFERVLDNEEELAKEIRKTFNNSVVRIVHLENLTICEQIAYGHNADILLGVHGSGLVHLWWLRDKALVYEMEPHYEVGNPTFRMLSRIAGRKYHSEYVGGGWKTVHSNVQSIVRNLKKYSNL